MGWKDELKNCFGMSDRLFAVHAIERKHARSMLTNALSAGATWADVEAEARTFLVREGCGAAHVDKQISHMADLRSYLD
jgi:hypothetical protein